MCPDLPGHGADPGDGPVDLSAALRVVEDAVVEASAAGPPVLCGYSMGGRIALQYAMRRSGSLSGLVLESTSPGLADPVERAARRVADEGRARALLAEGIEAFVDRWEALSLFDGVAALPAETRLALRRRRLASDPGGLAASLRGLGTGVLPSLWDELDTLQLPTTVLVGADDEKFRNMGVRMVERLPTAHLTIVPDAGHVVHLEAPDAWARTINDFGASLTGEASF